MMAGEGARATFMTETGVGGGAGRREHRDGRQRRPGTCCGRRSRAMSELSRLLAAGRTAAPPG